MSKCPISGKPCLKYKAYHVTNLHDKNNTTLNICEDCLSQLDSEEMQKSTTDLVDKTLSKIFSSCEFCGLTIEEFLKKGRLGCEKCYEKFEKPLVITLEKLHFPIEKPYREIKHVGRVPTQWKIKQAKETDPNKFLSDLKDKLAEFIKEEKYNSAKDIKDQISLLSSLIEKYNKNKSESFKEKIIEFIFNFNEKHSEENFKKE